MACQCLPLTFDSSMRYLLISIDMISMSSGGAATFRTSWLGAGRRRRSSVSPPRTPEAYLTHFCEEQATADLVDLGDMP